MGRAISILVLATSLVACGGSTTTTPDAGTGGAPTGGSGGSSGSGGAAGAGTGGAAGTGGGQAGSGGNAACNPPCGMARDCCTDHCVNLNNDPLNCGVCGSKCGDGTYCTAGSCVPRPCDTTCSAGALCCGNTCCSTGELCCDPQGPLDRGPLCEAPVGGTCPMGCAPLCICASPDTPIATPGGDRLIASLAVGDLVYSVDRGVMTVAPIVRTNRVPVSHHSVVRLALETGAVLRISAGHPTADGRTFGSLRAGEMLDGVKIESADVVPYRHDATYDILPDTDSGAYFAGGVLIGSTLAREAALVTRPTAKLELPEPSPRAPSP